MKKILPFLFVLNSLFLLSQVTYPKQNIELISLLTPNFGAPASDGRLYSGCWGWKQEAKDKEYAISGASNGTYFIDVSNPVNPVLCDYVEGRLACTWREMKTYQNYCYIVSDDAGSNRFQIVDMQYLPDSVHVVYDGTSYFEHAHTIWIDKDKMYIGSATYSVGFSQMNVYSLATPSVPVLLRELKQDIAANIISHVHDMFVRNDTVYASCGYNGLYIFKYDDVANMFIQLGSYIGYTSAGYNHSSFLTQNGKYLMFCDEVPASLPIHIIDVQNLSNIQPVQSFTPEPFTTSHNPYLIGNDLAIISCYQDGLLIYDISQPSNPIKIGFFDTFPQGGANVGNYFGATYRGNWGAYPYLPSGIIIANDMQNGVFILDPTNAYNKRVNVKKSSATNTDFIVYPNPASNKLSLHYAGSSEPAVQLKNMLGQIVFEKHYTSMVSDYIDVSLFANGTYVISVTENNHRIHKKIIINH